MAHTVTAATALAADVLHAVEVVVGWDSHSKRETFRATCHGCAWRGEVHEARETSEAELEQHGDALVLEALGRLRRSVARSTRDARRIARKVLALSECTSALDAAVAAAEREQQQALAGLALFDALLEAQA